MLSQWIGSSLMLPVARQDSSAPFFHVFSCPCPQPRQSCLNRLVFPSFLPQSSFSEAGRLVRGSVSQPGARDPSACRAGWAAPQSQSTPLAQRRLSRPELRSVLGLHGSLSGPVSHDQQGLLGDPAPLPPPLSELLRENCGWEEELVLNPSRVWTG